MVIAFLRPLTPDSRDGGCLQSDITLIGEIRIVKRCADQRSALGRGLGPAPAPATAGAAGLRVPVAPLARWRAAPRVDLMRVHCTGLCAG
jgi:hypothetical protein